MNATSIEGPAELGGLFGGLPLALRLLRMERGVRAEQIDRRVALTRGTYGRWEYAQLEPTTGELGQALDALDVSLSTLAQALATTRWIAWPPAGPAGFPERSKPDFLRARVALEAFGAGSRRVQLAEHGLGSFGEALSWLRGFFDLDQDELAELVRRTSETIAILEAGERRPSRATTWHLSWNLRHVFDERLAHAGHLGVAPFWWSPLGSVSRRGQSEG